MFYRSNDESSHTLGADECVFIMLLHINPTDPLLGPVD